VSRRHSIPLAILAGLGILALMLAFGLLPHHSHPRFPWL
jgi:hypothetical protein